MLERHVALHAMRLEFPDRKGHARGQLLGDVAEGLAYVRGHPGIGPLFLLMAIGAIWVRPMQDLLPGFADQVFRSGPAGLGLLTAAMGVGATVAAALVAAYARTTGLVLAVLLSFLVNMVATLLFVASGWLWLAMLFGAIWGGTLTMMSTGTQALVQSAARDDVSAKLVDESNNRQWGTWDNGEEGAAFPISTEHPEFVTLTWLKPVSLNGICLLWTGFSA